MKRTRLDATTLIGLPLGIGLILLGQVLEGGSARSVVQPTAALIVFGGTLSAVLVSFTMHDIKAAGAAVRSMIVWRGEVPRVTIDLIILWASRARKHGLMPLEDDLPQVTDPFFRKGLGFAIEGISPHAIRETLELESASREDDDEAAARVYEAGAGYAPTFGILGAVLGLMQVMQQLADPSRLGAGIAVAFVATVYGLAAANLVLHPIATKLRIKAHFEARRRQLILEGIVGITEGLNPRTLRERLVSCSGRSELEERHRGRVA